MFVEIDEKNSLLGGFEAGGTKFNCVVGKPNGEIISRHLFATTTPKETFAKVTNFFRIQGEKYSPIKALGIAHFGPIELNLNSLSYGWLRKTPKPYWSNINVLGHFSNSFDIPIAIQTDVNGSAIGERAFGAAKGCNRFAYVTVGTGIGVGVYSDGKLVQGIDHPEIGHMQLGNNLGGDEYPGCCPYHHNCLEGLASGTAIKDRWGVSGNELEIDHPAWELEARYLAILCVNLSRFYSPELIVFGGGVMNQIHLIERIREHFILLSNGYLNPKLSERIENYIILSQFNGYAAEKGVLVMANKMLDGNKHRI